MYSPARYSSSERSVLGRRLLTSRATAPPDIWKKAASCIYLQCICYDLVPNCSIHPCFKCVSTQSSMASMAIKNTKKADALFRVEVWQCHMGIFHFLAPTLHGGHTKSQAAAIWITIITILQCLLRSQNMFQNERLTLTLRIFKRIPLLVTDWQQHHSISTTKVGSSRECATPSLADQLGLF